MAIIGKNVLEDIKVINLNGVVGFYKKKSKEPRYNSRLFALLNIPNINNSIPRNKESHVE
ncbi:hypothetical protein [Shouchella patagoniensis]|uniref:hypothetical protein n=1 Tax=Shouchella patagoniensis TaxID=228576 RepID=UPI000994A1FE|nr:hypothetical protein [Shouchella patagoniensis]